MQSEIQKDFKSIDTKKSNVIFYVASLMADYYLLEIYNAENKLRYSGKRHERERSNHIRDIRIEAEGIIRNIKRCQYQFEYLIILHPELKDELYGLYNDDIADRVDKEIELKIKEKNKALERKYEQKEKELLAYFDDQKKKLVANHEEFLKTAESNLSAIPYMATIVADYQCDEIEHLIKQLDWGRSQERLKKVASLQSLKNATRIAIEELAQYKYQLSYLLELFPNLEDVLDADFSTLPNLDVYSVDDYDRTRDWVSKEEYEKLNNIERNQLALDRYIASHSKTKWQVGRDYELYVGYIYKQKGYDVDYFGSYMGLEDLGRDIIAKKADKTCLIQCKYWSRDKKIHEKHITQLYGTVASYCIENSLNISDVSGVLITNIELSDMAKKMANYLNISYIEKFEKGEYPCIKCNIGHDDYGITKIYHLPFDQQYDSTKISSEGEFFAMTVKEAEDAGFRRAFKWFKN